jgi:hypothetical protein
MPGKGTTTLCYIACIPGSILVKAGALFGVAGKFWG